MLYVIKQVIESFKEISDELFCFFVNNQITANSDKCKSIASNSHEGSICTDNYSLKTSEHEKRIRIKIGEKLIFNTIID